MIHQSLGRAVTLVHSFARDCMMDDEYGAAMGAPMDEMGPLIARSQARSFRRVRRQIKALTGLEYKAFVRAVELRTSPRWVYMHSLLSYPFSLQRPR